MKHYNALKPVKALSFDLDDTLWHCMPVILAAEDAMIKYMLAHHPRTAHLLRPQTITDLKVSVKEAYPAMAHDMTFLRLKLLESILEQSGYDTGDAEEVMQHFLHHRNQVAVFPMVLESLKYLKQRYPLFAITNGNSDLEQTALRGLFDDQVNPQRVGVAKPSPAMFDYVATTHAIEPCRILHIGDSWPNDVQAAYRAGFQAAWFNPGLESVEDSALLAFEFSSWQALHHALMQEAWL